MALRMSCLIHGVLLLLLLGCATHRPILLNAVPDAEIAQARDFVGAVADKMPMWDEDAISCYERVEIATVKADIAMARQMEQKEPVKDVSGIRVKAARRLGCAGCLGRDAQKGVAYMKSKDWIEQTLKKPEAEAKDSISKRTRLAEALLTSRKERRT